MTQTRQTWVVDQITEMVASVEIDSAPVVTVPLALLPVGAKEGDVYAVTQSRENERATITFVRDTDEQARRLARSREQVKMKSPHDPGGDIQL